MWLVANICQPLRVLLLRSPTHTKMRKKMSEVGSLKYHVSTRTKYIQLSQIFLNLIDVSNMFRLRLENVFEMFLFPLTETSCGNKNVILGSSLVSSTARRDLFTTSHL